MIVNGGVTPSERTAVATGAARGIVALVGAAAIAGAGMLAWYAGALGGLRGIDYEAPAGMALLGFLIGALLLALVAGVADALPKTAVIDVQGMVCSG